MRRDESSLCAGCCLAKHTRFCAAQLQRGSGILHLPPSILAHPLASIGINATPPHTPTHPHTPRRFKEMEAYILQRRDELTARNRGAPSGGSKAAEPAAAAPKGFS